MKKLNKKEQERFNRCLDVLVEESKLSYLDVYECLEKLVVINASLNRLNEIACSYQLTDRQEKRAENLENQAIEIIKHLGFEGATQNDPRGNAVMIYLPSGKFNSWDGETFRINVY